MTDKKTTRSLFCALTAQEFVAHSEELAKSLKQLSELELDKARISARMKPIKERVTELVPIVDDKQIKRVVDCHWEYAWNLGEMYLIRDDTGEEVDNQPIPEGDKQAHLSL